MKGLLIALMTLGLAGSGCATAGPGPASTAPVRATPTVSATRTPTGVPSTAPEGVVKLSGPSTETTAAFSLPEGDVLVDWSSSGYCVADIDIVNPGEGFPAPPLWQGDDGTHIIDSPGGISNSDEINLVAVVAGTYQVRVGTSRHCPWSITFTPGQ